MKITKPGIKLIKSFEGLELWAYRDVADVWTIGYGHTRTAVEGMKITEEEAERLLEIDLTPRVVALNQWAKNNGVTLNQNEFNALVSFSFNVGIGGFVGSTAARRLINNDRLGAADALTWWNKARVNGKLVEVAGLTRRRAAEKAMFLMPVDEPIVHREANARPEKEVQPILATPIFGRRFITCFPP